MIVLINSNPKDDQFLRTGLLIKTYNLDNQRDNYNQSIRPISIYSWSISHILNMNSSLSDVWAAQGSKAKTN